jgi:hypothetical protein
MNQDRHSRKNRSYSLALARSGLMIGFTVADFRCPMLLLSILGRVKIAEFYTGLDATPFHASSLFALPGK